MGARVQAARQNAPQRGDVGGGGREVRRRGPATGGRRPGEVAEAAAPLGRRADLSEAGTREGGAGAGVRRWHRILDRRKEDEGTDVGRRRRRRRQEASLAEQFNQKDQPPLRPSRLDAGHPTVTAGREQTLKTKP